MGTFVGRLTVKDGMPRMVDCRYGGEPNTCLPIGSRQDAPGRIIRFRHPNFRFPGCGHGYPDGRGLRNKAERRHHRELLWVHFQTGLASASSLFSCLRAVDHFGVIRVVNFATARTTCWAPTSPSPCPETGGRRPWLLVAIGLAALRRVDRRLGGCAAARLNRSPKLYRGRHLRVRLVIMIRRWQSGTRRPVGAECAGTGPAR